MAGLSNERLNALNEMIRHERKFQSRWLSSTAPGTENPDVVRTSIEYIGMNPDPCRYHLDQQERFRMQSGKPEFQRRAEILKQRQHSLVHATSSEKSSPETSAQVVGWKVDKWNDPGGQITQEDISGPSARGFLYRENYSTNWSGIR